MLLNEMLLEIDHNMNTYRMGTPNTIRYADALTTRRWRKTWVMGISLRRSNTNNQNVANCPEHPTRRIHGDHLTLSDALD